MNNNTYFEEIGAWSGSVASLMWLYVSGFVLSLAITVRAYFLAVNHTLAPTPLTITLLVLAMLQFLVQLVCFLHLSTSRESRERLSILICALILVSTLVVGSIWVMGNLNTRMSSDPTQMNQYMNSQSGL